MCFISNQNLYNSIMSILTCYIKRTLCLLHKLISASLTSSSSTMKKYPCWQAVWRGLAPFLLQKFIIAPFLSRSCTIFSHLCSQAVWTGLVPSFMHKFIFAPLLRRSWTTLLCSFVEWSGSIFRAFICISSITQ